MTSPDEDLRRTLATLRDLIWKRGFTQSKIEQALGWRRSYVSQLLNQHIRLRLEQLLLILDALDVEPADFFAEVYRLPRRRTSGPVPTPANASRPHPDLECLQALLHGLVAVLESHGRLTPDELTQAIEAAEEEMREDR